jgi:hypothetical protein
MYVRGYLQGSENGRVATIDPRRLLESARHGFYHGMMEDVLNDESENLSLSQLLANHAKLIKT